jgi:arabinofuranosyltransferase
MSPAKRIWISIVFVLPFAGILFLNAGHYFPFLSDDALISLRYAQRMLDGHGLTWTDGRPVEGYSNLLWILLVALLSMFHMDLIDAVRVLGFVGMIVIMLCVARCYLSKNEFSKVWLPLACALLFLSLSSSMAVWSIGGLEQPLYGALIAMSIVLMGSIIDSKGDDRKRVIYLALVLGLLCVTRPDGPIFVVAAAVAVVYMARFTGGERLIANLVLILTVPFIFYAGQTLFRLYYYGEWVPNTALVKITPSLHHFLGGLEYLVAGLASLFPFSLIAIISLIAILVSPQARVRGVYLLGILVIWSIYIIFIGGDIFPAYRHFIPIITVFAFLLVEGFPTIKNHLMKPISAKRPSVYAALWILLFIPFTYIQFADDQDQRAAREQWEWMGKDLGLTLKDAFPTQRPVVAVTAAGSIPYWSELPALDMLGLNDYYLPRHRPKDIGKGLLGHELGNGKYVLNRKPDIIVFNVGSAPQFRSGREMQRIPEFHEMYKPVMVKVSANRMARVYFNKYSKKIGIRWSPSKITVPGFLFNGKDTVAYLGTQNNLVSEVARGHPVSVSFESEPVTHWAVEIRSPDAGKIGCRLKQHGGSIFVTLFSDSENPVRIEQVILRKV